jgi:hypothetical protein
MSKKNRRQHQQGQAAAKPGGSPRSPSSWLTPIRVFADLVAKTVDRFGWGGAFVVLGFFFVQYNGTAEQKQQIINKFVLGKELNSVYPFLAIGTLAILIFFGQNYYWRKRVAVLNDEIMRLSKWKSDHQQQNIAVNLHHTETQQPPT